MAAALYVPLSRSCFFQRAFSSLTLRRSHKASQGRLLNEHSVATRAVEHGHSQSKRYTQQIVALGWEGKWDEAVALFDTSTRKDTILYNAVLGVADKCGRYDEGLAFFAEMQRLSVQLTAVSYGSALTLLGRRGEYAQAHKVWAEMHAKQVSPTPACLTGLLNSAAVAGDVGAVERHLSEASAQGIKLNRQHLGCLLSAHRQVRDPEAALKCLQAMRARGIQPGVVQYFLAVGACARAAEAGIIEVNRVDDFLARLRSEMASDDVSPDAYFIEEHLKALLGGKTLQDMLSVSPATLTGARVEAALCMLEEAHRLGIRNTRLAQRVESWLREALSQPHAGSSKSMVSDLPLPAGWQKALDPTSSCFYYWSEADPHGTTTWQRPA